MLSSRQDELLRIAPHVSIIHEGIHVWRRGTNNNKTFSVLNYWRNLKISQRFLSLILFSLNLASLCSLPAPFPRCLPFFFFFFPFDLQNHLQLISSQPPPRTRWTPLSLAARDEIFKVYWNPGMIKQDGDPIVIHLSDSNLMVCKMIKCALVAIITSQRIIPHLSSCYSWRNQRARWESQTKLPTCGRAIKYG